MNRSLTKTEQKINPRNADAGTSGIGGRVPADIGANTQKSEVTGNLSLFPITKVSVDLDFISGDFDAAWLRFRYKSGSYNGWLYPLTSSFASGWNTYSVVFDPTWTDADARAAGWLEDQDVYSSAAPSMPFALTMSDAYSTEVRLSGVGFLEAGIDNFETIPEPSSVAMIGLISGCGVFVRRRFLI